MQSITVPLQGFLNALVYGWTREDFLVINKSNYNSKKTYGTVDVDDKSSMDEDEKELKMGTSAVNIMDVDITLPIDGHSTISSYYIKASVNIVWDFQLSCIPGQDGRR